MSPSALIAKAAPEQQPGSAAARRDRGATHHKQQQEDVADRVGEGDRRAERRAVGEVGERREHHRCADGGRAEAGDGAVEQVGRAEAAALGPRIQRDRCVRAREEGEVARVGERRRRRAQGAWCKDRRGDIAHCPAQCAEAEQERHETTTTVRTRGQQAEDTGEELERVHAPAVEQGRDLARTAHR